MTKKKVKPVRLIELVALEGSAGPSTTLNSQNMKATPAKATHKGPTSALRSMNLRIRERETN